MSAPEEDLIGPSDHAFTLDLTPPQLKIVHAALMSFRDDFGHAQPDGHRVIHERLAKRPDEASSRASQLCGAAKRFSMRCRMAPAKPAAAIPRPSWLLRNQRP
jgi:hypothetical protein